MPQRGKHLVERRSYQRRFMHDEAVLSQFIAQPSKHAQRMLSVSTINTLPFARVRWEPGRRLPYEDIKRLSLAKKKEVARQFADIAVDFLRLGIRHGDVHDANIAYIHERRRPLIRVIDFEHARPTSTPDVKKLNLMADYRVLFGNIEIISNNEIELKKLRDCFRKRFLDRVNEL